MEAARRAVGITDLLGASSAPAAIAGHPLISVPAGDSSGLPVGLTFMGTAHSEPTLIKPASGFEAATEARRKPQYLPTLPTGPMSGRRHRHHSSRRQLATNASPAETRPTHVHL